MRSRFCLFAIVGLSLAWNLRIPCAPAQGTASELVELQGKVVNSVTGEPVAGALVQIYAPGRKVQFTASDGTFAFTDLPPGSYSPFARKPGFFNDQELSTPMAPFLSQVRRGEPIVLKLTPEAILYGEVKNANGLPFEGVTVRVERWQVENGRKLLVADMAAVTDDEGSFRLSELKPGRYYVSFPSTNNGSWSTTHQLSSKRQVEEGFGPQFYPGVPDLESATVIEIRAGAQVHLTQTLSRQRLFEVSGVVRGADPETGFSLMLTNSAGDAVQKSVRSNPKTGQFQIPEVPAGTYLLQATANQRPLRNIANGSGNAEPDPPPPLTATLPVHVQGDVSGLVVVLGSGITVGVQVRDEVSDNGVANNPHQISLQMTSHEFSRSSSGITIPPYPGDRKRPTQFEGLAPGTYTVNVWPSGPWYVSSMRCGSLDLLREDLTIAPGAAPPPIEVTLRGDGAQLTMKVTEKGEPAIAGVVLFSQDYPYRSQFFGSANSFSVGDLAPGKYYVIAIIGAENVEFRNPIAMDRYLAHATEVTLGPRTDVTVVTEVQQQEPGAP